MTVYYFGIYSLYGGMERFAINIVSAIVSAHLGTCFHLLVEEDNFAYKDRFLSLPGVSYTLLPSSKRHPFAFRKAFVHALKDAKEEDVLQINACSFRNGVLFGAARKANIRTIVVGHLSSNLGGFFSQILHRWNQKRFASRFERVAVDEKVAPYMFGPKLDARIIHNGINVSEFMYKPEDREEGEKILGETKKIRVGLFGRFCKQKNQEFAIQLFQDKDIASRYELVLCGNENDSGLMDKLKGTANDSVIFLPEVLTGMKPLYASIDVLLIPSLKEGGLSLVMIEALSTGCSVLAADHVGIPSIPNVPVISLPLEIDAWKKSLLSVSPLNEKARECAYLQLTGTEYDIQHSAEQYYQFYKN